MNVVREPLARDPRATKPQAPGGAAAPRRGAVPQLGMRPRLVAILLGIAASACDHDDPDLQITIDQPTAAEEWVLPADFPPDLVVQGTVSESPRGPIEGQDCKIECSGWPCLFPVQTCWTTYAPRVRVTLRNEAMAGTVSAMITLGSTPYRWSAFPVTLRPGSNRLVAVAEDGEFRAEDVLVVTVP